MLKQIGSKFGLALIAAAAISGGGLWETTAVASDHDEAPLPAARLAEAGDVLIWRRGHSPHFRTWRRYHSHSIGRLDFERYQGRCFAVYGGPERRLGS